MDDRDEGLQTLVQAEMNEMHALMCLVKFTKENGRTLPQLIEDMGLTTPRQYEEVILAWTLV